MYFFCFCFFIYLVDKNLNVNFCQSYDLQFYFCVPFFLSCFLSFFQVSRVYSIFVYFQRFHLIAGFTTTTTTTTTISHRRVIFLVLVIILLSFMELTGFCLSRERTSNSWQVSFPLFPFPFSFYFFYYFLYFDDYILKCQSLLQQSTADFGKNDGNVCVSLFYRRVSIFIRRRTRELYSPVDKISEPANETNSNRE